MVSYRGPSFIEPDKRYKMYLVELDNEDRERVLECRVGAVNVNIEDDYSDIYARDDIKIHSILTRSTATLAAQVIPDPNGNLFTLVDFREED